MARAEGRARDCEAALAGEKAAGALAAARGEEGVKAELVRCMAALESAGEGAARCEACPKGRTTMVKGTKSSDDCICEKGSYARNASVIC